jgi:hypothetical protein
MRPKAIGPADPPELGRACNSVQGATVAAGEPRRVPIMRAGSVGGQFTKIGSIPPGTTSFSDTTVTDKTLYDYTANAWSS